MTKGEWWVDYQSDYLGSAVEQAEFFVWCEDIDDNDDRNISELMGEFRESGAWTDGFLDWAWEQRNIDDDYPAVLSEIH